MTQAPLLQLDKVSLTYTLTAGCLPRLGRNCGEQSLKAVEDVSFAVQRGETVAIVGESGCGKSSLAKLIAGLERPTAGQITFPGDPVRCQMIFQDPFSSLNPRWRVGDIIAEPILVRGERSSRTAVKDRVAALLRQVCLSPDDMTQFPHQFSGGQRQRISIARALADNPQFLICDEPTSALDVSVQAQILNLMQDLQQDFGLTYLFISHNLAVVHHMADKIGVMYLGRLVEWTSAEVFFDRPFHPYSRMLLDALPDVAMSGRERGAVMGDVPSALAPPSGCHFNPRCPLASERCRTERPQLLAYDGAEVACHAAEERRLPRYSGVG